MMSPQHIRLQQVKDLPMRSAMKAIGSTFATMSCLASLSPRLTASSSMFLQAVSKSLSCPLLSRMCCFHNYLLRHSYFFSCRHKHVQTIMLIKYVSCKLIISNSGTTSLIITPMAPKLHSPSLPSVAHKLLCTCIHCV